MSKPKFKVDDAVKVRTSEEAAWAHKTMSEYVPAPGTVGAVEKSDDLGCWIRWTGEHGCHADRTWVPFEYVEPIKESIVIYRSGRSVFAKDHSTGKIAEAKCSPEDEFDFHKGATLAFDRLLGREEPKQQEPKYYNGKVVCVKKGRGLSGECNVTWWTVGRIYDVVDGVIRDNKGNERLRVGSLAELNMITHNYAEFIALVE